MSRNVSIFRSCEPHQEHSSRSLYEMLLHVAQNAKVSESVTPAAVMLGRPVFCMMLSAF